MHFINVYDLHIISNYDGEEPLSLRSSCHLSWNVHVFAKTDTSSTIKEISIALIRKLKEEKRKYPNRLRVNTFTGCTSPQNPIKPDATK